MDKNLAIFLGNAARQARTKRQLTQEAVAELLDVSAEFYSRIERGQAHPGIQTFLRMMSVLGVSADALLGTGHARQGAPDTAVITPPADPAELRQVLEALRRASPSTRYLVRALLNELDRASVARRRHEARTREQPPLSLPPPEDD